MKTCSKCKVSKSLDDFSWSDFGKSRARYCKTCHKAYRKTHYEENRSRYLRLSKEWNKSNAGRQMRYGLSVDDWYTLAEKHGGKCWICLDRDATMVDHDHSCCPGEKSCGKCIRGALCGQCNTGLGMFKDNTKSLGRAVSYLKFDSKKATRERNISKYNTKT